MTLLLVSLCLALAALLCYCLWRLHQFSIQRAVTNSLKYEATKLRAEKDRHHEAELFQAWRETAAAQQLNHKIVDRWLVAHDSVPLDTEEMMQQEPLQDTRLEDLPLEELERRMAQEVRGSVARRSGGSGVERQRLARAIARAKQQVLSGPVSDSGPARPVRNLTGPGDDELDDMPLDVPLNAADLEHLSNA